MESVKLPGMFDYKRIPLSEREFDLSPCDPTSPTIHIFSNELILKIFDYLRPKEVICSERVCRRWQALVYRYFNQNYSSLIEREMDFCLAIYDNYNFVFLEPSTICEKAFTKALILCGKSLKSLYVLGSNFSSGNILLKIAQLCPSLRTVGISNVALNKSAVVEMRKNCKQLRGIKLGQTNLSDEYLEILFDIPKLRTLELTHFNIDGMCLSKLPEGLTKLKIKLAFPFLLPFKIIPDKCSNLRVCNIFNCISDLSAYNKFAECLQLRELSISFDCYHCQEMSTFNNLRVLKVGGAFKAEALNQLIIGITNIDDLDISSVVIVDKNNSDLIDFSPLKNMRKLSLKLSTNVPNNAIRYVLLSIFDCQNLRCLELGRVSRKEIVIRCMEELPSLQVLKCLFNSILMYDIHKLIAANKKRKKPLTLTISVFEFPEPEVEEVNEAKVTVKAIKFPRPQL